MRRPVEPHELSGLLDGELDAQRAAEVRRAMEENAELRAEYDRLCMLDRTCSTAASQAAFKPGLALPHARTRRVPLGIALGLGLIVLLTARLLPKVVSAPAYGVAAHLLMMAAVVVGLIWLDKKMGRRPLLQAQLHASTAH